MSLNFIVFLLLLKGLNPFQRCLNFVLLWVNRKLNNKKKISISFVSVLVLFLLQHVWFPFNLPFGALDRERRGDGFKKFFSESLMTIVSLFLSFLIHFSLMEVTEILVLVTPFFPVSKSQSMAVSDHLHPLLSFPGN